MKKKFSVMTTLLLAILLVLTGCSTKKDSTTDLSGDKPVLKHLGFKRNFDPNTDAVATMLEKETGYKVNYEVLPMENTDDKLNLMMANKEEIDILKLTATQYHKLAAEGALAPLDDLLSEYGKTLLEVNDEESWKTAQIDGKTYGIPERSPRAFVGDALGIRKDVLEQLNAEMPTNLDELYNLLIRIRDETNFIPMTGFQPIIHPISGAFGINAEWVEKDGKIVNRVEEEGMKEYIEFMQKLYAEKLIDQEWPINDHAKARDKFAAGEAAIMASYGWGVSGVLAPALEEDFGTTIEFIMGLEGKDGQKGAWLEATGVSFYIAIPNSSKNKEHTMNYLNMKVQPDLFKQLAIGTEGVHWEEKDGKKEPILPAFDERANADWFITSTDQKAYSEYWLLRTRKNVYLGDAFERMQVQVDYGQPEATTFAPPMEANSKYHQRLVEIEKDYIINAIADPKSAGSFDDFVKRWNSEGGEASTVEYNKWLSSNN